MLLPHLSTEPLTLLSAGLIQSKEEIANNDLDTTSDGGKRITEICLARFFV